ncbi:hypothetical protein B0H67DRAFT_260560 [Lasiosphaeris hirsuta]|uniref:Uncharacterized protein n=1 Tax=Lasiosphaeris hirsuta TaxID=260670 RepID=A0AA40AI50_9PEZI|nr:hypothetical protein B0H67DRAFT_260560 [Lasiosphaeris hirsuta]
MTPQAKKYKHDEKMKFAPPEPKAAGQGQAVPLSSIPEHARIVETDDLESDGLDFSEILQADRGKHWSNLAIPRGLESRGETIALFMPILAYEEHRPRKKMTKAIGRTRHLRSTFTPKRASTIYSTSLSDEMDKRKKYDTSSVDAYLKVKNLQPLHCRRTLDQYCYYMLDNTEARDRDQVVYKWARKQEDRRKAPEGGRGPNTFGPEDDVFTETQEALFDDDGDDHRKAEMEFRPKNRPVIMVDQLWLWVLPDGTVISSLPNCANPAETYNLKYKLEMSLFDDLNNPIRSADDLTTAILKNCVDFFRREGPCFVKFQDCFQYSISNIAEEEARTYADYENAVKELERKEQGEETSMSTRDYTDTFSRITTETNRLVEIMDIQDELNIVDSVLLTQETVLESLVEHIKDVVTSNSSKTSGDGSKTKTALDYPTHIQEAIQIVKQNRRSVADMVTSAKRVQDDLKQLLDFKQQQSSAWEMRYSRKLAQQGRRQNNIMLMFTVVTIIFLPMSFISSFFAINIDAFPKDPGSGDTSWPLGTISAYLFGISLALSFPLILGACYINRVARMASKRPKKRAGPGGGSTATNTTKEHDSDSSDSDLDSKPHLSRHHHHHHHHHRIRSLSRRESIDSHTIGDTFTEEDENSDYAPLFHHFRFHHRIPLLRRLWKYGTYRVWELEGLDAGLEEFEWDYPLNQFRKMATWPVEEALRRVGLAKLSNRYSDHERAWRSNQEDDETMRQLVREKMEMRGPWEWEGGLLGRRRTGDDGVVVGDGDRLFRRKRRVGDEERMY